MKSDSSRKKTYIAIDLKSYYASAECAARGLDPLTTNLVVADESRTEKTICLAVSPSLKALGIPGRARLFEVVQKIKEINVHRLRQAIRLGRAAEKEGGFVFSGESHDASELAADPSLKLSFIIARPRMSYYMKTSAKIYNIYQQYIAPEDTLVYSVDEVFLDATAYLPFYHTTAHELAMKMIRQVLKETQITATAGIGTNLYLAKLAMDIVAKHMPADKDGVRIAELDEESFRYLLWDHRPLTDFWMTGRGTQKRLAQLGIHTMGELARFSLQDQEALYREFGVNAEILIDHAFGQEPCTMADIKAYKPVANSISEGQVLSCPYSFDKAKIIVAEMADTLVYRLTDKGMVTDSLTLDVGYDRENVDKGTYKGEVRTDHYGRLVPKPAHGTVHLDHLTNLSSQLIPAFEQLFDRIVHKNLTVRRMYLTANRIVQDDGFYQMDLFHNGEREEKEKNLQKAMLDVKKRFGSNAVFKATSLMDGATLRQRNGQIGGHRAD